MYSIKAITSLTGLGAETLRAWERRYQAVIPQRNESGRRFYSAHDLEKLQLLANLTRQGHTISKLAPLKVPELQQLVSGQNAENDEVLVLVAQIGRALREYRLDRCEYLLKRALLAKEPLPFIRDVLTPAMLKVGELWEQRQINVAQEHMFSECVKRILIGLFNSLHTITANRPSMLFATPAAEQHEFGILFCCLLAAEQDFNCYYLGPSAPTEDILDAARKLKIDILVLSIVQSPLEQKTDAALAELITSARAENINVWIGGAGAQIWRRERAELSQMYQFIVNLDEFYLKAGQFR